MSRYFLPGFNPYSSSCSAMVGAGGAAHPVLRRLLSMAPDRAGVLAFVEDPAQLAEEALLQQAGGQMLELFMGPLPSAYRQRGQQLEVLFRTMVGHAFNLVMMARFAPEQVVGAQNNAQQAKVMAYVATQQVIGARRMAMDLYNSR
ncbi:MAG: hypothetical protein ABF636_02670 [Acetobacter sp.]